MTEDELERLHLFHERVSICVESGIPQHRAEQIAKAQVEGYREQGKLNLDKR